MKTFYLSVLLSFALFCGFVTSCRSVGTFGSKGVVVLDIGHSPQSEGAQSPAAVNGKMLRENAWWYEYCYYTKLVIEKAGYRCYVCNRGNKPTSQPLLSYAARARVLSLRHPDKGGERYPSHYFPDRVASGMVSADYAIYKQADAVVFLHHNSAGSRWSKAENAIILSNRYNGQPLAQSIAASLNRRVLNHGMPNGGKQARVQVRYVDADRAAGWLNACDDAGIPAAVTEAAFLNNRAHAAYLSTAKGARAFAEAVGEGVVNYLNSGRRGAHRRANPDKPDEGSFGYAPESRKLRIPGAKLLIR